MRYHRMGSDCIRIEKKRESGKVTLVRQGDKPVKLEHNHTGTKRILDLEALLSLTSIDITD